MTEMGCCGDSRGAEGLKPQSRGVALCEIEVAAAMTRGEKRSSASSGVKRARDTPMFTAPTGKPFVSVMGAAIDRSPW